MQIYVKTPLRKIITGILLATRLVRPNRLQIERILVIKNQIILKTESLNRISTNINNSPDRIDRFRY